MRAARHPAATITAALACVAFVVTSCTSSSPTPGPSPTDKSGTSGSGVSAPATSNTPPANSSSTPSPSTSTYADPKIAAAVKAYRSFIEAYEFSQQHPPKAADAPYAHSGDFTKYSFDPIRAKIAGSILFLTQGHLAYHGTPPAPRPSVTGLAIAAKPYPTITIEDCPTAPANWKVVAISGQPPTSHRPSNAAPPYRITAQVIFYLKRWGVYKLTTNTARTCTP